MTVMRTTIDLHTGKPFQWNETALYSMPSGRLVKVPVRQTATNSEMLHPSRVPASLLSELNPKPERFQVARRGPAWDAARSALAGYIVGRGWGDGSDLAQINSVSGEAWQYMGSSRTETGQVSHEFCHRDHPATWSTCSPVLVVPAPSSPPDLDLVEF